MSVEIEDPEKEKEHLKQLRRALIASTIGTTIEWYDFFLYSTATPTVFNKIFFPPGDPDSATVNAFAVYAVGFVARPIGAAIFGHFGDRLGRKNTLLITLVLMCLGTFLVAFVPNYSTIGMGGAGILSVLRFIQGIGVGGEWGGAVVLSMEWTRVGQRGFSASWPQFGVPAGLLLANAALLLFGLTSPTDFLAWGWRIPFGLSIFLLALGVYIRLGVMESPTYHKLVSENRIESRPVIEALRSHPKQIILSTLVRMSEQAPFYIFTSFVLTFTTGKTLGYNKNFIIYAIMVAAALGFVTIPGFGYLSDRLGRKPVYIAGAIVTGVFGFIYFAMLDTKVPGVAFLAVAISLIPHDMQYGPQAAMIAEGFPGPVRYSGASIGYQLASLIAGGPAPLIATAIYVTDKTGYGVAGYIACCSLVSVIAALLMPERAKMVDVEGENTP